MLVDPQCRGDLWKPECRVVAVLWNRLAKGGKMDKRVQIAVFLIACTLITTELGGVQQIGVACADETGEFSSFESRPLQSWTGERFVFLNRRSSDLSPNCRNSCIREFERHPSRYAGRIALVTRVQPKGERWEIQFEFEDNGERLVSRKRQQVSPWHRTLI